MKHHNIQQRTLEWGDIRLGKITASNAHVLYMDGNTKGRQQYRFKLAYERLFQESMPEKFNGNRETGKGIEAEQYGKEQYEMQMFEKVHEPGFFEIDGWVGCSPDGLVGKQGLIEIKALTVGNTFREKILNDFTIEQAQYEQCQFQLMITYRRWVDLIYVPPTFKAKIQIRRVERSPEYIDNMWQRAKDLNAEVEEEMSLIQNYMA
jgi:hypothetical protein